MSADDFVFSKEGIQEKLHIRPHSENREKIILEIPEETDFVHSRLLEKFVRSIVPITDYKEESKSLILLNAFFREWVEEMAFNRNISHKKSVNGYIYPFGSYKLGVASIGSDIDCVCICPYFIAREDFLTKFSEKLKENGEVEYVHVIYAMVPIIQIKYRSFEIDLSYAGCTLEIFPEKFSFSSTSIIYQFEKESILSIGGIRFIEDLLRLLPKTSFPSFKLCLRAVKIWAKRRNIYNNKMGYLGGVHLTILVARICQIYPLATASQLLYSFFQFYSYWVWPRPIYLTPIEYGGMLKWDVWNPFENELDAEHVMPIITPSYPSRNTSYNATVSTLYLFQKEVDRGKRLLEENRSRSFEKAWNLLITPVPFLVEYAWILRIQLGAKGKENCTKWVDFVESRVRFLVKALEITDGIKYAVPCAKIYNTPQEEGKLTYSVLFLGLIVKEEDLLSFDSSVKELDLSYPLKTWKKDTKNSKKRPDISKLSIRYSIIRYADLDKDVGNAYSF
jgi:poly(A) polymerase